MEEESSDEKRVPGKRRHKDSLRREQIEEDRKEDDVHALQIKNLNDQLSKLLIEKEDYKMRCDELLAENNQLKEEQKTREERISQLVQDLGREEADRKFLKGLREFMKTDPSKDREREMN